jgi:UDP-2,4-diacetamido-2,4,6-trideoxy-beta-L-altropyranose hydrolase
LAEKMCRPRSPMSRPEDRGPKLAVRVTPDAQLLLLRADGGPSIGAGHVMRSLALADAWQDAGGQAVLAAHERPGFFDARLEANRVWTVDVEAEPGSQQDADSTVGIAQELGAQWVAIDGYRFGSRFQERLRDAGLKVLMIDDEGSADHCSANVLLNPNLHAESSMYPSMDTDVHVLFGPRYALLRREFWAWGRRAPRYRETARRVLVLLGGSDTHEFATWLMDAIEPLVAERLRFNLVAALSDEQLTTMARRSTRLRARLNVASSVQDMPALMAGADLALSAGGGTCWELAFLGIPTLVLALAENQRLVAQSLGRVGAALDLGWYEGLRADELRDTILGLAHSGVRRRTLGEAGRAMVDGAGGRRVVMVMRGDPIRLRAAEPQDLTLLWHWANDPEVRAASISQGAIGLAEHRRWFKAQLSDPGTFIFIAVDAVDQPVGQVRFTPTRATEATIHVSLSKDYRGRGLGRRLIEMASRRMLGAGLATRIHAFVRQGNETSMASFSMAGYQRLGDDTVNGTPVAHWVLPGPG